jgi:hypothetical protein
LMKLPRIMLQKTYSEAILIYILIYSYIHTYVYEVIKGLHLRLFNAL